MAATYTPTADPVSDKDLVRGIIKDTDTARPIFQDEEITGIFLRLAGGNIYGAASLACLAVASSSSRRAVAFEVLGQEFKMDRRSVAREWRLMADLYRKRAADESVGDTIQWVDDNMENLLGGMVQAGLYDLEYEPAT